MRQSMKGQKKSIVTGIVNAIVKVFDILRAIITIVGETMKQLFFFIVFMFSKVIEVLSHPTIPAVIAISLVVFVLTLAVIPQWTMTGVVFARFLGASQAIAITVSLTIGLILNGLQLWSELWKVSENIAKSMKKVNIDPAAELDEETLDNRLNSWNNFDFLQSKKARRISYIFEFAVVGLTAALLFAMGTSLLNMAGSIAISAISLFAPEQVVKIAAGITNSSKAIAGGMNELDRERREQLDIN